MDNWIIVYISYTLPHIQGYETSLSQPVLNAISACPIWDKCTRVLAFSTYFQS